MATDTEKILGAIQCVDGKVGKLDNRMTGHLAWHDGVKEAEEKESKKEEKTTARVGAAGSWFRALLLCLVIIAGAIVFVVLGVRAVDRAPADEVRELRARMDKLIHRLEQTSIAKDRGRVSDDS